MLFRLRQVAARKRPSHQLRIVSGCHRAVRTCHNHGDASQPDFQEDNLVPLPTTRTHVFVCIVIHRLSLLKREQRPTLL
jgi:hypothetical protein